MFRKSGRWGFRWKQCSADSSALYELCPFTTKPKFSPYGPTIRKVWRLRQAGLELEIKKARHFEQQQQKVKTNPGLMVSLPTFNAKGFFSSHALKVIHGIFQDKYFWSTRKNNGVNLVKVRYSCGEKQRRGGFGHFSMGKKYIRTSTSLGLLKLE